MVGAVPATVVSGLLVAIGVIGTIVPVLPGAILVFAGMALFGFLTGWDGWAVTIVAFAALVSAGSVVLGIRIPARATARSASRQSLRIGAAVGIIGFFLVPVVGLPLGWLAGVYLSETTSAGHSEARKATLAALRSFGVAAIVQFGLALGLALVWGTWAAVELFG